jgi:hypothetical protein
MEWDKKIPLGPDARDLRFASTGRAGRINRIIRIIGPSAGKEAQGTRLKAERNLNIQNSTHNAQPPTYSAFNRGAAYLTGALNPVDPV